MNPVEQLNLTIWSWIETVRSMRKGALFVPFLFMLGAEALVFACLWGFASPVISWFMAPLMIHALGEQAIHYPVNFLAFPALFTEADLALGVLFGSFLFGAAALLFAGGFGGRPPHLGDAFGAAGKSYFKLALGQLPATVLASLVLFYSERHIALTAGISGNAMRLYRYGGFFLSIAVQALFAFTLVIIMLEGTGLFQALGRSMKMAGRNVIGCLLLVGVPSLLHYPASALVRRGPLLVQRGAPEMLAIITAADILLGIVTNYLWLGGITRFYLAGRREA